MRTLFAWAIATEEEREAAPVDDVRAMLTEAVGALVRIVDARTLDDSYRAAHAALFPVRSR